MIKEKTTNSDTSWRVRPRPFKTSLSRSSSDMSPPLLAFVAKHTSVIWMPSWKQEDNNRESTSLKKKILAKKKKSIKYVYEQ